METPSPGWATPSEGPSAPESSPESEDLVIVAFLRREVLPALGARAPRPLRDAVRRAIRDRRLAALERLSGRHRHELLVLIERLAESKHRPAPSVLVRLTTVVSATPAVPDLIEVAAARPAR